jgi:hypothetical protein
MRYFHGGFIAALVLTAGYIGSANTFAETDAQVMFTLRDQAMKHQADIAWASQDLHKPGSVEHECLGEMSNDLLLISFADEQLRSLVVIASAMSNGSDEAVVLKAIKRTGHQLDGLYVMARGDIEDHIDKSCSASALVKAKAQSMLEYLSTATLATNVLLAKLN